MKLPAQHFEGVRADTENSSFYLNQRFEETSMVPANTLVKTNTNNSELDETITSMMNRLETGGYICNVCGKIVGHRTNMKHHIEAKHIEGVSHPCGNCGKLFGSRNSLGTHVYLYHKAT